MTAPTVAAVGSLSSGTGATRTPGVPAGTTLGEFVMVLLGVRDSVNPAAPTDFSTQLEIFDGIPALHEYYKIEDAVSDGATYSVPTGTTALGASDAIAMRIAGVHPSDPFHPATSASAVVTSATIAATSLTDVAAESTLVWMVEANTALTCTPPPGFIRQTPNLAQRLHVATLEGHSGDTGSISGTLSGSAAHRAALVALSPEASQDGAEWNGATEGDVTAFEWDGATEVALSVFEWDGTDEIPLN